ncbi:unnamed protein product [Owenia fusiformis]|uniref:VWFA domain-containing protein n=1 Tax=Owenia fusiformis TaxID=6347 RepID=A0A8S4NBD3_OWEFU|nr:unnamed protein product [Owenia fusiformis]
METMRPLIILLVATFDYCLGGKTTLVKLEHNGYIDVVVAIGPKVDENTTIITELKNMIVDASHYLYNATRKRAYFKKISILVPSTWSDDSQYENANLETFENADFRVDTWYNNNPYTRQLGQCGEPASYCHLTPDYVLDTHNDRLTRWGPPGRLLVHEFAHLRYGIFDEYGLLGSTETPPSYMDSNGKYVPTGCTDKIKGTYWNKRTNVTCNDFNMATFPEEADCMFIPDVKQTARASVMYLQFLESVMHFCESDPDEPDLVHNMLAPNLQNLKCNKRGTWDVIMHHEDFSGNANPPRNIDDLTPEITVRYRRNSSPSGSCKRMVLVLDKSGSMSTNKRLFALAQAAYKCNISGIQDRESLAGGLATQAGGSTAIGEGVIKALDMLKENGGSTIDATILVLSDGQENAGRPISEVLSSGILDNTRVKVDSIAFSRSAAQSLEDLVKRTGGTPHFYSEDPTSTALEDAFIKSMGETRDCIGISPEVIRSEKTFILRSVSTQYNISVDGSLRYNTTFMFTPPTNITYTGSLSVTVTSPSNITYTATSPEYTEHASFFVIRFVIPGISDAGTWTYVIQSSNFSGHVGVNIRSFPQKNSEGITMKSWTNKLEVNVPKDTSIVYAEIAQGYAAVKGAQVEAVIELPGSQFTRIALFDNGAGSDNFKDDGVYSNFFPDVSGDDRYSVTVKASNPNGSAMVQRNGATSGSSAYDLSQEENDVTWESIGDFERESSGGSFKVANSSRKEEYPPGRVDDFSVERVHPEKRIVALTWTAPGQNAFSGTVTGFEIFVHHKMEALVANHLHGYVVHKSDLVDGSLEPLPAFSRHRIVIRLPKFGVENETSYSFVMWSWDELDIRSDLSNYISANIFVATTMGPTTDPETTALTTTQTILTDVITTMGPTTDPDTTALTTTKTILTEVTTTIGPSTEPETTMGPTTETLDPTTEADTTTNKSSGPSALGLWIGIPIGTLVVIILIFMWIFVLCLKKSRKRHSKKSSSRWSDTEKGRGTRKRSSISENDQISPAYINPIYDSEAYGSTPGHSRTQGYGMRPPLDLMYSAYSISNHMETMYD